MNPLLLPFGRRNGASIILLVILLTTVAVGQPPDFNDQVYVSGFAQAVGMAFDDNGRMYVWEKGGKVWIVENGVKSTNPLIDMSEEVGNWRDFGLLGFALDPNFLSNGHIYLLYIVDRHHLLNFGTPSYSPTQNEYFDATIGRITRYTAESSTNYTTVDYNSRLILLGDNITNGLPHLHQSHGIGSLVFGTDGTLLASMGDGASYNSADEGSASDTYWSQALADGIITSAENVGAYRSQLLSSYNGKVLRIDPATGLGLPSNPYYDVANPNTAQSKIWAMGLRNPCRMNLKPNTGSLNPADGNPGVLYIGDVGWGVAEEINVVTGPGANFGWPTYEGMTYQPAGYSNPAYAPPTHTLAKAEWRNGTPRASVDGVIYNIGSSQVPGPGFFGNCSIGGVWYTGDDFPVEYKNTYFHADYGGDWIRNFGFNGSDNPVFVKDFMTGANAIVFIATHPVTGGLYWIGDAAGNSNNGANAIHKITYANSNLPPQAVATSNIAYGPEPLTVQFTGDQSSDPENGTLTYLWDFGDGNTSTQMNPSHTFSTGGSAPVPFSVTLTVTDDGGETDQATLLISVNNTPPVITSTSIDNTDTYSLAGPTTLNLSAQVSDAEHSAGELTYAWQTILYHNNHDHPEPIDNNPVTTTLLSPVGCDGDTYFYRIRLTVTDAAGLSTLFEKDITPDCGPNQPPIAQFTASPTSGIAPLAVSFNASGSSDPDGTISSYQWDFGDGATGSGISPSHTYTSTGSFAVSLTVTDNLGETDNAITTISVSGSVTLTSIADAYVDSKNNKRNWNFGSASDLRVRENTNSNYQSYLKFDINGQSINGPVALRIYGNNPVNSNTVTVEVYETGDGWTEGGITYNNAPGVTGSALGTVSVNNSAGYYEVDVAAYVQVQAGSDGIVSFVLTSANSNSDRAYFNSKEAGSNPPQLRILDPNPGNQPPVAAFSATPTSGTAPLSVGFNAGNSNDPDGSISSYSWDFGDGSTGSGVTPNHTFSNPGGFTVVLTVTDNEGATDITSGSITVTGSGGGSTLNPVADAYTDNKKNKRNNNFGTQADLRVRNKSAGGYQSYLRFDLTSVGIVSSAVLRLYGNSTTGGNVNVLVNATGDGWSETGITYNNAPGNGLSLGNISVGGGAQYREIDVTAYIQAEASGDGAASFVLSSGNSNADEASLHAREGGNTPQLVINGTGGARYARPELSVQTLIYPNPFEKSFQLEVITDQFKQYHIEILNLVGQVVFRQQDFRTREVFRLTPSLPGGHYLIHLYNDSWRETLRIRKE